MFVVIFEVQPKAEQFETYLELAGLLRPEIKQIDGFIDNERFRSLSNPQRLVSLSTWRDEKALIRWRTHALHHSVQEKGRFIVFENYRLRVGEVCFDNAAPSGQVLPQQRFDATQSSPGKAITILEQLPPQPLVKAPELPSVIIPNERESEGLLESELYESIYNAGKTLLLKSWRAIDNILPALNQADPAQIRYREVRVIRAYGMFDRAETPQYYPDVTPTPAALAW